MMEADKTKKEPDTTIYQLKVSIAGARPQIWRRVLLPAHTTLAELHTVIQALMGWYNDHLHQFETPGPTETNLKTLRAQRTARLFGPTADPAGEPFDWLMEDELDEAKAILKEVAPVEKTHFLYIYDMGDQWEHDILVEKILPADPKIAYPICLAGKRNGPIEDCGGLWGYEEMLEILADPTHAEYKHVKVWLYEVYGVHTWDGEAFDKEGIDKKLKKLRPKKNSTLRKS